MKHWWMSTLWLGFALAAALLMPAVALASDCSDPNDCEGMARGAAAIAAGAGAVAAAASNGSTENGSNTDEGSSSGGAGGEGD